MKKHEFELIARVLGEGELSPETRRWLETGEGRRELAAYRRTLRALNRAYDREAASPSRRVAYYTALDTPVGHLFVAATEAGLVRVSFRQSEAAFVSELRRHLKTETVKAPQKMTGIVAQLQAYLGRRRQAFDLPIDLSLATPFQRSVLLAALQIPRGHTATYAEIARRIGRPRAARAVGQALSRNPVPIIVPCHRVLASDGSLRGYLGSRGTQTKARLLELEGVARRATWS